MYIYVCISLSIATLACTPSILPVMEGEQCRPALLTPTDKPRFIAVNQLAMHTPLSLAHSLTRNPCPVLVLGLPPGCSSVSLA